jgi:hypothetical protein
MAHDKSTTEIEKRKSLDWSMFGFVLANPHAARDKMPRRLVAMLAEVVDPLLTTFLRHGLWHRLVACKAEHFRHVGTSSTSHFS